MSDWVEDWGNEYPHSLHDMAGVSLVILDALHIGRAYLESVRIEGMSQHIPAVHNDGVVNNVLANLDRNAEQLR